MSVAVPLEELAEAWDKVDESCFLLTTNGDGTPHPAHVQVRWEDPVFVVSAGRRSHINAGSGVAVTLLWPARSATDMSLLVDGSPEAGPLVDGGGGSVVVRPTSAIWHRQPESDPASPA